MDTLCVPRRNKTLRQHAIREMSKIYKEAEKVLVLDSYIQNSRCDNLIDSFFTIACSAWVRRLWTLQESMLPGKHKVYFKFDKYGAKIASVDQSLMEVMSYLARTRRKMIGPVESEAIGLLHLFWGHNLNRIVEDEMGAETSKKAPLHAKDKTDTYRVR
jgi:hypothetical protein